MEESSRPIPARVGRALLGIPLFLKITVANAALAAGLVWFAFLHPPARPPVVGGWLPLTLGLGAVAAFAVNALLVHLALLPLRRVEATARAVEDGDLSARIPSSPLADRTMTRLTRVVNRMLDALERFGARQAQLSRRILEVEESERKRIARELFDDPAQLLSSALLRLRIASRALEQGAGADAALEAAREDAAEALSSIQRIARGLRPPGLDELGASAAVEAYARGLVEGTGVRLEVGGDAVDPWLSDEAGLVLYRVLQEGISNALTHAGAHTLRLGFRLEEREVFAELADDGSGFDLQAAMDLPDRSVGLLHMLERARHAGGRLAVDSAPGRGTRLSLVLPRSRNGPAADPAGESGEARAAPAQPPRASRTAQ